jgi:hypothetical protein
MYDRTCAGVAKEIALRLPENVVSVNFIIIGLLPTSSSGIHYAIAWSVFYLY